MPFDRLVRAVDEWAADCDHEVFAQTGQRGLEPRHMPYQRILSPAEFRRTFESADLVVAHAGMGTILTALQLGKPLLVLPRTAALGETRNDHQIHTAEHFAGRGLLTAAMSEEELRGHLEALDRIAAPDRRIGEHASTELIEGLGSWLREHAPRSAR